MCGDSHTSAALERVGLGCWTWFFSAGSGFPHLNLLRTRCPAGSFPNFPCPLVRGAAKIRQPGGLFQLISLFCLRSPTFNFPNLFLFSHSLQNPLFYTLLSTPEERHVETSRDCGFLHPGLPFQCKHSLQNCVRTVKTPKTTLENPSARVLLLLLPFLPWSRNSEWKCPSGVALPACGTQ